MYFRQIQHHGDNFSYIVADDVAHEAIVVDPSLNAGKIMQILKAEEFSLKYVINTHGHSDHTAGNEEMRSLLGAKVVAHRSSRIQINLQVDDGDFISVGDIKIKILHTPGHSIDSICLLVNGKKLLTGDTLFIGECGRTDLPGGNPKDMYHSLFSKLLMLSDDIEVYPGHDYGVRTSSTIGEERKSNYTLQPRSMAEFVEFMKEP